MKNKIVNIFLITLFVLSAILSAQEQKGNFNIVVLSDVHISNDKSKDQRLFDFIDKINSGEIPNVKFVVVTGDFVSAVYTAGKEQIDENSRLVKGISIMNNLKVPYYIALGNHDYKIDNDRDSDTYFPESEILEMEKLWKDISGFDKYFVIEESEWNFIFLNSMRGRYLYRAFDDEQMTWVENVLKQEKPAVLFFHHPIETDNLPKIFSKGHKDLITPENEPEFFELVNKHKENIKGIFFGHVHIWAKDILYKTIPTYLTNSFGDQKGIPFHLLKIDLENNQIKVDKVHLNNE